MFPYRYLYHGTCVDYIDEIEQVGLQAVNYDKVYLTSDLNIAFEYAQQAIRNQQSNSFVPLICMIDAFKMYEDGFTFTEGYNEAEYTIKNVPSYYIETFVIFNDNDLEALAHYAQEQL